jgi:transcriptional regulator with XRE-family HTH domain
MGRSAPKKSALARGARRAKAAARSTEDRPAVGKRVRYLRRVKRMTLNDLAATAGCSVSLLSRVENDVVTPSLSTLHRLCHALDTSVSALLTEPGNQDAVVYGPSSRPTHARAEAVEGDGSSAESLVPFADTRLLEGLLINLPAGRKFCGPFEHHGEEVGYVLEGQLELVVNRRTYVVKTGDSFFFRSDQPHLYRAKGKRRCRVIWINTPPTF